MCKKKVSSPSPIESSLAIKVFPPEAPDTVEQRQAISTVSLDSWPTESGSIIRFLFYTTKFTRVCSAAIENQATDPTVSSGAMDKMLMFPPEFRCWLLTLNEMAFRSRAFGRVPEVIRVEPSWMGLVPFSEKYKRDGLSSLPCKDTTTRKRTLTRTQSCWDPES